MTRPAKPTRADTRRKAEHAMEAMKSLNRVHPLHQTSPAQVKAQARRKETR